MYISGDDFPMSGLSHASAVSVAVLMTCHNRREQTLNCLRAVFEQSCKAGVRMHAFVVDDGSTDGTSDAIESAYTEVTILKGSGSLYWTGGMRLAVEEARKIGFDFYLWLNDDTLLYTDAIGKLLDAHASLKRDSDNAVIVVGSICDPETGELCYGGSVHVSAWHRLRFSHIEPDDRQPERCDVFNGNCVLVSNEALETTGNLHPRLVHAVGDYEYGLRARKNGVDLWVAPGYFGECSRNPIEGTWLDSTLTLKERYKHLLGVKGQPLGPRFRYYAAHGGVFWPILFPLVYLRPLLNYVREWKQGRGWGR